MKALVLEEYNELAYKEAPKPKYKPNEVLVRVKACGICGSDVHGMDGSSGRRIPPLIMGHEAFGIIEACGADVTAYEVKDRVFDIVYESVGIEETVNTAIENTRKGGVVTLVGNLASNISFPLREGASWFKRLYNKEPGLNKVVLQP